MMKPFRFKQSFLSSKNKQFWRSADRYKWPLSLFTILCTNLLLAPTVQAATGEASKVQAYALGILGLATLALFIYLFVVMFQPERF